MVVFFSFLDFVMYVLFFLVINCRLNFIKNKKIKIGAYLYFFVIIAYLYLDIKPVIFNLSIFFINLLILCSFDFYLAKINYEYKPWWSNLNKKDKILIVSAILFSLCAFIFYDYTRVYKFNSLIFTLNAFIVYGICSSLFNNYKNEATNSILKKFVLYAVSLFIKVIFIIIYISLLLFNIDKLFYPQSLDSEFCRKEGMCKEGVVITYCIGEKKCEEQATTKDICVASKKTWIDNIGYCNIN